MNTAVNVNVVHESEAQRQFARVKLPARIRYIGANREGVDARLLDLSAGGFAFTASGAPIQPGDLYKGKLLFQVDSISFSLEVEFQVRSVDPARDERDPGFLSRQSCPILPLDLRRIHWVPQNLMRPFSPYLRVLLMFLPQIWQSFHFANGADITTRSGVTLMPNCCSARPPLVGIRCAGPSLSIWRSGVACVVGRIRSSSHRAWERRSAYWPKRFLRPVMP